jgi:arylsulfatase A-like enzyme
MFGKIHLGGDFYRKGSDEFVSHAEPEDSIDFARGFQNGPLAHGFNHSYVLLRGIWESPYAYFEDDQLVGDPNDLMIWEIGVYGDSRVENEGIGMPYWDSSEVGPILTQKAIEFIDGHHQQNLAEGTNTPFFVYYAAQSAHSPQTPPNSFHGEPVKGVTGMTRRTDMVYEIDLALGKLVEAVRERGLIGNTLIIFTSDNGIAVLSERTQFGHDSAGGLRGQKNEIWEAGHRVPFVAKWGDGTAEGSVIPPGTVSTQLIGVHDLTATLAAVVGQELPNDQALDSFNFLPVFLGLGNDDAPVRDHLIMEGGGATFAFREGQWKLIVDGNYNVAGLYDLVNDLPETNNLMDDPSQAARIQGMRERFVQLRNAAHTRELPECSDGLDNDDDGRTDHPDDPGCLHPRGVETTKCQDGQDNDSDGRIDFDGGASLDLDDDGFVDVEFNPAQPAVTGPDAQCIGAPWKDEERAGGRRCGLGSEIILVLPPLWVLRRRKARLPRRGED